MKTQSYSNHVRVHPPYHYIAVPISLALIVASVVNAALHFTLESVILVLAMIVLHMAVFLSREYAKKNQDRIIRAELRLRYYQLTQKRMEDIEGIFTTGQLLAMRFSGDDEFLEFLRSPETIKKQPDQIKKEIIQWNADWMRV